VAKVNLICINCNNNYQRYESEIKKRSLFCCRLCAKHYQNIKKICIACKKEFIINRSESIRRERLYCSKSCIPNRQYILNCLYCKNEFNVFESSLKRGHGKFCSNSCSTQYRLNITKDHPLLNRKSPQEGRDQRGSKHNFSKLTESEVIFIRKELDEGKQGKQLALEHNVSVMTISNIKLRKNWKHI